MPLLEIDDLTVEFADRLRLVPGRRRRVADGRCRRHPRDRRRIRLGQVGGDAGGDGAPALARERHARTGSPSTASTSSACQPRQRRADRRQGHGDDLPGADVEPQSVLHRRLPDRRGAEDPPRPRPARSGGARAIELLDAVGIPDAGALGLRSFPAPAFRRHEPAGDDRHGARLPAEAADRRRADDGARRDHPGADPRPSARPAEGDRHGAGPHHPRHGRRRRDGGAGGGALCRPEGRGAGGRVRSSPTRIIPTRRRCSRRFPNARPGGGCRRSAASCPAMFDRPGGCLFSPRCGYATRLCRTSPRRARGRSARLARFATIRCADGRPRGPSRREDRRARHERAGHPAA